jgi:hypothetical protein
MATTIFEAINEQIICGPAAIHIPVGTLKKRTVVRKMIPSLVPCEIELLVPSIQCNTDSYQSGLGI